MQCFRNFKIRQCTVICILYIMSCIVVMKLLRSKGYLKTIPETSETFVHTAAKRQRQEIIERISSNKQTFSQLLTENRTKRFPVIKVLVSIDCNKRKLGNVSLTEQTLPLTALASPFRSGNTWLRHLLQMATGIGTSSVYCDRQLQSEGYPYECSHEQLRHTLVVKTHGISGKNSSGSLVAPKFERAVLIIRDPYAFIVANNHVSHLDVAKEENYFKEEWRRRQKLFLDWWHYTNYQWLVKFQGPVYPVLYSNLLMNTETELRKLLNFLRVEYKESDIECAMENKEGNFHRKHFVWTRIRDITELFNSSMKARIESSVKPLASHLKHKYGINWVYENHTVNTRI